MIITQDKRPYFASYYRWLVARQYLPADLTGLRVLDVGCDDANFLAQWNAPLKVGTDLAPRAHPGNGTEIVRANACLLPLIEGSFDCVMAFDILEHIVDDQSVMQELLRVLAPGGTLWFSTPAVDTSLWPSFVHAYANRAFGHVRNGYSAEQLAALLPSDDWNLELYFWNEPMLRAAFVLLHGLDTVAPNVAAWCTRMCFALDKIQSKGNRGHIFGRITRKADRPQA